MPTLVDLFRQCRLRHMQFRGRVGEMEFLAQNDRVAVKAELDTGEHATSRWGTSHVPPGWALP